MPKLRKAQIFKFSIEKKSLKLNDSNKRTSESSFHFHNIHSINEATNEEYV